MCEDRILLIEAMGLCKWDMLGEMVSMCRRERVA